MALVVSIAGVPRKLRFGSMVINPTVNGRDTFSAVLDILDGGAVPLLDDELLVTMDSERIFGGVLTSNPRTAITSDASVDLRVSLSAGDFNALADRRYVPELASTGGLSLKSVLLLLLPYLAGVTLAPGQLDGPTLAAFRYDYRTPAAIMDELTSITGWIWEISYFKVLRMWAPGADAAPWALIDGGAHKAIGDITVEPTSLQYANRVILRAGPNAPQDHVDGWTSDGVGNVFTPTMRVLQHYGFVWTGAPAEGHSETLGGPGAQWVWTASDPPTFARAAGPLPATHYVLLRYNAQFPVIAIADDLVAQAARGIHEVLVDQPEVVTGAQAQAIVTGLLPRYVLPQRTVKYATRSAGLHVGQSQLIQIARRGLNANFFITEMEIRMHSAAAILIYTVTAQEAMVYQGSWRDLYKQWSQGGGSGGLTGSTSSSPVPAPPTVPAAPAYFLGASSIEWQQGAAGAWLAAGAVRVQPHGLPTATVTVRLRARAGSVTPRLSDVTAGSPGTSVGSGTAVTSTTLQTTTFPVALTDGHTYELQLQPSLADTDVQGIGYLA
jgi:hypothetical protein